MRFEKYLTFRGHPEGDVKSGGGFRLICVVDFLPNHAYNVFEINIDKFVKSLIYFICHAGLDPASSNFNKFWTPALVPFRVFAGVTGFELFTRPSTLDEIKNTVCIQTMIVNIEHVVLYTLFVRKTLIALRRGGKKVRLPDEYICNMCGFMFLSGEKLNIFCPECGSSMVAKEVSYEEFLDEDAYNFNFKQMIF